MPVAVIVSALALPKTTFPLNVAAPAHVSALMLKSFVPSDVPLMMSEKFVLTCEASAVVPFVNVFETVIKAIARPPFYICFQFFRNPTLYIVALDTFSSFARF